MDLVIFSVLKSAVPFNAPQDLAINSSRMIVKFFTIAKRRAKPGILVNFFYNSAKKAPLVKVFQIEKVFQNTIRRCSNVDRCCKSVFFHCLTG